jgi:sulfate transport system permease protein
MTRIRPTRPAQFLLIGIVILYAAALILLPIISVIQAALANGLGALLSATFNPDVLETFALTLKLALSAVAINAVAGTALAWVLVRHDFPGKRLFDALVDAPFIFSPVIAAYAMLVLFGRNGLLEPRYFQVVYAWPGMLLVTIFVTLPFVTRELQPVLKTLTLEQEEAAFTLGAKPWTTFRRVIFPQIRLALIYGIVLTFTRAIGDFGAVSIIGGNIEHQTETATIYLYRAFQERNNAGAYGVALALVVISILALVVMNVIQRRTAKTDLN